MHAEDQVVFRLSFRTDELTLSHVDRWIDAFVLFEPEHMCGTELTGDRELPFDKQDFLSRLEKLMNESMYTVDIVSDRDRFTLRRGRYYASIIGRLSYEQFEAQRTHLLTQFDEFFQTHAAVVGFMCSASDNFWQNNTDVKQYARRNKPTDHLQITTHPQLKKRQIVDVEYHPGHSHLVNEVWFGSCWRMWFGEGYFPYIPKEALLRFQDGYETKEIGNGAVAIALYADIWDYDRPENREKQWKFRRQVGMDEVAHALKKKRIVDDNPDPAIEILTTSLQHGGVKGIRYYYNEKQEVVSRSKATESRTYEFDQHGEVIWSEIKKL